MRTTRITMAAGLILGIGIGVLTSERAAGRQQSGPPAASGTNPHRSVPRETITMVADHPIPNLTGKRLVSRVVEYPPGGGSVSHRHARSAFIYAFVLSGAIRSQLDDGPVRIYRSGDTWFENPGTHHRVSENASATQPARLLAVLVVDAKDEPLTIPDPREEGR